MLTCHACNNEASYLLDTGALQPVPDTAHGIKLVRRQRPVCLLHLGLGVARGYPFEVLVAAIGDEPL